LLAGMQSGEFATQSVQLSAACIVGAFTEALIRPVTSIAKTADKKTLVEAITSFCVRAASGSNAFGDSSAPLAAKRSGRTAATKI
jgi:hypothetical protein